MKHTNRILCAVLAIALTMSVLLTGCTIPGIQIPGTPDVAATHSNGQEIATGEYLAYLYLNFENIYYNQGLYQYPTYGMDPWEQEFPYTNEDGKDVKLPLDEYIIQSTKDTIINQIATDKVLKDNGIEFTKEDYEKFTTLHEIYHGIEEGKATYEPGSFLPLGINDEHYLSVLERVNLDYYAAFFGLYGKDGIEEVKDKEIRKYFDDNYLSYKVISIPLTKADSKDSSKTVEMTAKEKKEVMDKLNGYLKIAEKDGFEKAMDQYNKDNAKKDEKVEATKDKDNRQDVDANKDIGNIDENLAKEIRKLKNNEYAVVEYKSYGETATAVLIQRLDINDPKTLYTDSYDSILFALKGDAFTEMMEKEADKVKIEFNEKVIDKCNPKNFIEDLEG